MMEIAKGAVVRDTKTQIDYVLDKHIASGLYSQIYVVRIEAAGSGNNVGVPKIAKVGSVSEDQRQDQQTFDERVETLKERYEVELRVVERLRDCSGGRFAPETTQCEWIDKEYGDVPVLLMDRMGNDTDIWSLASQLRALWPSGLEAERLAVQTAGQYVEMLTVLHSQLNRTCSDRKSGDVYWDSKSQALYVLDWNVVGDLNVAERKQKIQSEIRLFGRLWFEMLVGLLPENADLLSVENPKTGSRWAELSKGIRRLLVHTLTSGLSEDGYGNDQQVGDNWKKYNDLLRLDIQGLYDRALQEKQINAKRNWKQAWETIDDICDLLSRMPGGERLAQEVNSWLENKSRELDRHFERAMELPKKLVPGFEYDQAASYLEEILVNDTFNNAHRCESARWLWVARTLSAVSSTGSGRDVVLKESLVTLLESMQHSDWPSAKEKLQTILGEANK